MTISQDIPLICASWLSRHIDCFRWRGLIKLIQRPIQPPKMTWWRVHSSQINIYYSPVTCPYFPFFSKVSLPWWWCPCSNLLITLLKIDVPNFNTRTIWTFIFKWYVVRCGSKNGHQNDTWLKDIGLCAQNMLSILGSLINLFKGPIWLFNEHENLQFW